MGYSNPSDYTASVFGSGQIYIPNYTSSNFKSISVENVNENMKGYSDPDMFIDYLERMRAWLSELGAPIEDKPFVMDILSKLPGKYDVIIERIN